MIFRWGFINFNFILILFQVQWCKYSSTCEVFIISNGADNILHIFGCSGNNLVKLPKLEIPSIYSIKEKSLWLFRLYDENYLGHLIAINDESRLFIYKINQGAKSVIEEAFCVLGPVRESYGVSIIDNLIVVSYLQVNWDSQVIVFNNSSNLQAKNFRHFQ